MEYRLRKGTKSDADTVANQRALMFHEMGVLVADEVPAFQEAAAPIIAAAIKTGSYHQWLIELPSGPVVAGGGVQLRPLLPRPDTLGPEAIILNMYVAPAYRRRGLARRILEAILDWCQSEKIERVVLHASDSGRPLYESMGFEPTSEMRLLSQKVKSGSSAGPP
jgi:GNAT superfamily N-acetyltransferase